jgi:hypothetical protein
MRARGCSRIGGENVAKIYRKVFLELRLVPIAKRRPYTYHVVCLRLFLFLAFFALQVLACNSQTGSLLRVQLIQEQNKE